MRKVPELSLSQFTAGDRAARAAFSEALSAGLREYGFIILTDHNVALPLLERAYALAGEVFALPEAEKRRYAGGLRGYTPFGIEHAKGNPTPDLKEFWQIGHDPEPGRAPSPFSAPNVWPERPADFQTVFQDLFAALNETGCLLLEALAPTLGLTEDYFEPLVRRGDSVLRVLHYPPIGKDADPGAVRAAAHEDINLLTILVAARGAGLELLDRDGAWLPVRTEVNALIVDSGDMMARLTNNVIPATTHRVVNSEQSQTSRYSMPFFMHPTPETSLAALPSCIGAGARHAPISAGDFLAERLKEIGLKA
ncbi:MAG TPA: 2-oxoglutarate and iron-dependent oxygenase domain-containing protein [Terricaulis sp.]|nr:2-oxoglutarate and iron-dependent oxygenase domain-containing protein [Terricaulis sp.]